MSAPPYQERIRREAAPRSSGDLRPPSQITDPKVCPECAGPLVRASTCMTCLQCGWGRCS